ncbi:helix-turn-helix domain-containing protein [Streptomyces smyrnaeus]|uniref:helix-turn-helix domain-containing protein n=1 Tax=Streptomyces TaxID=1883 RepID=UPI000C192220|nr:helix-turn-helix transcriptional regulator [Streptomyces sp. B15]MBQ1124532.1 helix-turn-helix domain-containing protein [Streptomyces sp. B15]MBQ1157500.1 helix-turn-helix domain-containing protein [Streptomyces sp. A73]
MATESAQSGTGGAKGANSSSGSMVRRILLGSQLRRLREARGVTREAAGYSIRASESKISRMELGRVSFKARDVEDLLTLYGVTDDAEREPLLDLARDSSVAGWWHNYSDVLPGWFQTYVGLEAAASYISTYEVQFVHGLLQTGEYAHAVVAAGHRTPLAEEEVERRVALRLERQKLLLGENAPELVCVLDEAALRRPFGSKAIMEAQLAHLAEISEQPNVRLHVVPFELGGHAAESGAFTLLRFPESDLNDIVYLEQLTSALYLDKRDEVAQYDQVLRRLVDISLSPEHTRDHLHRIRQLL